MDDDYQIHNEIRPRLWLGDADAIDQLSHQPGWFVISCGHPSTKADIFYPIHDTLTFPIQLYFQQSYADIKMALSLPESNVLVACAQGINRSPTILAYYLMREEGLTAKQAIMDIQEKRVWADPQPSFRKALYQIVLNKS